jgi:hypothetical protein
MKALSLWQPWASLIAVGAKRIETRGWATKYRGPIAIHAALRPLWFDDLAEGVRRELTLERFGAPVAGLPGARAVDFPFGAVVAVGTLANVWPITVSRAGDVRLEMRGGALLNVPAPEIPLGQYENGRYGWTLTDVRALPAPIHARGRQGLWDWTPPEGFTA